MWPFPLHSDVYSLQAILWLNLCNVYYE